MTEPATAVTASAAPTEAPVVLTEATAPKSETIHWGIHADGDNRREHALQAPLVNYPAGICGVGFGRDEGLIRYPLKIGGRTEQFSAGQLALRELEAVIKGLPPLQAGVEAISLLDAVNAANLRVADAFTARSIKTDSTLGASAAIFRERGDKLEILSWGKTHVLVEFADKAPFVTPSEYTHVVMNGSGAFGDSLRVAVWNFDRNEVRSVFAVTSTLLTPQELVNHAAFAGRFLGHLHGTLAARAAGSGVNEINWMGAVVKEARAANLRTPVPECSFQGISYKI